MSEGGFFPWKMQWQKSRGPAGDYSRLKKPLPSPPEGSTWHQDKESKEWSLLAVDRVPELQEEQAVTSVAAAKDNTDHEDEWEILSDRHSMASGSQKSAVFVTKVGSVRSITTLECYETGSVSSVPFKFQRTNSSSTLDSNENSLGPSGKGILGVDYYEHVILPTDTLQGICLAYKVSSTRLKQANHFSGGSLLLAPKKLLIPVSKQALRSGFIRVQDTDAKEYKLYSFLAEHNQLSMTEGRA
jgi:LysM repeat protein